MNSLADALWRTLSIGEPVAEFRFHPRRKWRFDYAWPVQKIAVEIDGGHWRKAGGAHSRAGAIRDMEKGNEALVLGWRVLHVTPGQFERCEHLGLIERLLNSEAFDIREESLGAS